MSRQLTIGLFGFGVVGEGIYNVLQATPSLKSTIKKICIEHPDKKRNAPSELFTTSYDELLNDPDINLIVELIDDAGEAFVIVSRALRAGKAVVSANKKMIAERIAELLELQKQYGFPFLYEAAVCGSIPVIRNLEEYYDNDMLDGICGIVNGSTNYILTRIFEDKLDYPTALLQAQSLGFAESDPSLDVEGIDAVNKLTILLLHGYGIVSMPADHLHLGINRLHGYDAAIALEKGLKIKLTAQARKLPGGKVAAFVLPQFVTSDSQLYTVQNEYNGVVLQSSFADKQFLYGKGAGRYPTASAVLSDISALRYDYRYEYRKQRADQGAELTRDFHLRIYVSFDVWTDVDRKDFEWVEEFHYHNERQYLVGVIHFEKLVSSEWINKKEVSLIVCPEGFVHYGEVEYKEIKEKFWKLSGSRPPVQKATESLKMVSELHV
ncbi:MAG: homoserine dehydrogenase [Chitinophagaceae bacterium]